MNHRIILSYLCVVGFLFFLAFAYLRYSGRTNEQQTEELKQSIVAAIKNDIGNTNQSIDNNIIEKTVKDTIQKNPEIVIQAIESYQANKIEIQKNQINKKVQELYQVIANNPKDPRVGSSNPKVKVIEFFDYSCGYCRKMFSINQQLIQNPDVQLILKETPILGEASFIASRISLIVFRLNPSKYMQFQQALWNDGNRTTENIIKLAISVGISEIDLKNYLNDKDKIAEIDETLVANQQLAIKMGIEGTPSYIIGDQFIPGAMSYDEMNKIIQAMINKSVATSNTIDNSLNANSNINTNQNTNTSYETQNTNKNVDNINKAGIEFASSVGQTGTEQVVQTTSNNNVNTESSDSLISDDEKVSEVQSPAIVMPDIGTPPPTPKTVPLS